MNEGHASLLVIELLTEDAKALNGNTINKKVMAAVHEKCVFTTHTPVPAGHDQFPLELADRVLQQYPIYKQLDKDALGSTSLNLTSLALNYSYYINGVAKKHRDISQKMYTHYVIHAITNGVHADKWASDAHHHLFDKFIPGWREDNTSLRCAISIPLDDIWKTHIEAKYLFEPGAAGIATIPNMNDVPFPEVSTAM